MNIHEFQGKEIFRERGIPVPRGMVAKTADEAEAAAKELGGTVVVKAQIHAGGRGKGTLIENGDVRGVRVCKSADEARTHAAALLGNTLVTHQTGPEGRKVKQVLVEEASDIKNELYAAVVLARDSGRTVEAQLDQLIAVSQTHVIDVDLHLARQSVDTPKKC